jgi:hypothetical protein
LPAVRAAYATPAFLPFFHPPIELASFRPRGSLHLDRRIDVSAICVSTLLLLAEHGRDLLRHHHPPSHPPRHLHLSHKDLIAAIETFIDGWNQRCQPFIGTKTVNDTRMSDSLLPRAIDRTSTSRTTSQTAKL